MTQATGMLNIFYVISETALKTDYSFIWISQNNFRQSEM